jgi:hypothetical protein
MKKLTLSIMFIGVMSTQAQDTTLIKRDTITIKCQKRCCNKEKRQRRQHIWDIVSIGIFVIGNTILLTRF